MLLVAHRTPLSADGCAALARAGAGTFELDVQFDGTRLLVSHFMRVGRLPRWLEHDNWRLRVVRGDAPADPLFADVVALVPSECTILLDPKLKRGADPVQLATALAGAAADRYRFRVSTADPGDLDHYRTAGFRTWRTIGNPAELDLVCAGGELADEGISIRHWLLRDAAVVARLHELARVVVAWTVNDPARARRLRDYGVDGITTDSRAVLAAIGAP